nr:hypothetical protein [Mesorhizobium sp. L2C054A000]
MDEAPQIGTPDLIAKAASDPAAREQLRRLLEPHLAEAVEALREKWQVPTSRKKELIGVGIQPFEQAFAIFIKDPENLKQDAQYFLQYYLWWMRQAIVRHLEI